MSDTTSEATESPVADQNPEPDRTPDPGENAGDETGQPQDDGDDDGGDTGGKGRVAREAAKWRLKFRESETTIAGQAATIERLQRAHVDAAIERAGVKPAAVHALTELADLVGEDGLPDPDRVAAAIARARDELGITKPNPLRDHRVAGQMHSGAGVSPPVRDGWAAAFGPKPDR